MKNDLIDSKVMHRSLGCYCMAHGGSNDCFGFLHKISYRLYDADGNELTDENRYTSKPHFKCKCDKCGYETVLPFDPDAPTILY